MFSQFILTLEHNEDDQKILEKIKEADSKKYIICCDISPSDNKNLDKEAVEKTVDKLKSSGLLSNHAYSLIASAEFYEKEGNKIQLFKIRNIWGTYEWQGDWSDNSSKWTPEIKKLLNYKFENDGTFWICAKDYLNFYTRTHICMFKDDYLFHSEKLSNPLAFLYTLEFF